MKDECRYLEGQRYKSSVLFFQANIADECLILAQFLSQINK